MKILWVTMTGFILFLVLFFAALIYGNLSISAAKPGLWPVYKATVIKANPKAKRQFASGAQAGEIRKLQKAAPGPLPESFIAMLKDTNGGTGKWNFNGIIFGSELLSVDRILSEQKNWQDIIDGGLEGFTDDYSSYPPDTIKPVYADAGWLPFVADGTGNFIALDYNPGPEGTVGQVISFGTDEIELLQLATGFDEFLVTMTGLVNHPGVKHNLDEGTFTGPYYIVDFLKNLKKSAKTR